MHLQDTRKTRTIRGLSFFNEASSWVQYYPLNCYKKSDPAWVASWELFSQFGS